MLAKLRVKQLACLLGQSLRAGRPSPSTPDPVHVDTKLCVCVCVCAGYGQSGECADLCV